MTTEPQPQPADELRAAAFQLRNPFHMPGLKVGIDPDLAAPLADWLDETAATFEAVVRKHEDAASETSHWVAPALAVARALSGPCPHCNGHFGTHSHELPGRRP